jgi:hypothetical protein
MSGIKGLTFRTSLQFWTKKSHPSPEVSTHTVSAPREQFLCAFQMIVLFRQLTDPSDPRSSRRYTNRCISTVLGQYRDDLTKSARYAYVSDH